ncbi:hypothetical protein SS50377_21952 [Spironucleus salmonicida]|uniref:Uncharacterized protein n=1 Tax=Spironucleus salmonicida TaxID=348837 RepID=V6LRV5_9EUKA|nr:hypothetical protein SS50377_21952 [Spironucleus salmonicida]|eukprot:EST46993.1 Hypothetical protein SS50377_12945 [Spironucleus salmonicida]
MQQPDLIATLQSALDPNSPSHQQSNLDINNLLQQASPDLLKLALFGATSANAPGEFREQSALLVKNFLTSQNQIVQSQRQAVWKAFEIDFKEQIFSSLMGELNQQQSFGQINQIFAALVNACDYKEKNEIIAGLFAQVTGQNVLRILQILLQIEIKDAQIPEFIVQALEQWQTVFQPQDALECIVLCIRILQSSSSKIARDMEGRVNLQFNSLLQMCVSNGQVDWICEILEFYNIVADQFDLLNEQINGQSFAVQIINLGLMFCPVERQDQRMSFIILELYKKLFSLPQYRSIYASNYTFTVIESCVLMHIENPAYFQTAQLSDIFVVVQELLGTIIQNASELLPDFVSLYQDFVYSRNYHHPPSADPGAQLSQLKFQILITPLLQLENAAQIRTQLLADVLGALNFVFQTSPQIVPPLLQQSLLAASFVISKTTQKHSVFNQVLALTPQLTHDFHYQALDQFLRKFIELDKGYAQNHLNNILLTVIRPDNTTISLPSSMVLINHILPTLEQLVNYTNYSMLLQSLITIFAPLQQLYMANQNSNYTYLQVIIEAINLPIFFIVQNQILLQKADLISAQQLVNQIENLVIHGLQTDDFATENVVASGIDLISVVLHKNELILRQAGDLKDWCIQTIRNGNGELVANCIDIVIQLPNYQPDTDLENLFASVIQNQYSTVKAQNAIVVYYWQKIQLFSTLPAPAIFQFCETFISRIDEFNFAVKDWFMLLQSVVLLYSRVYEFSQQYPEQFAFSCQKFIFFSQHRPTLATEYNEILFSVGYEECFNGMIRLYHKEKSLQNMILGYIQSLKKVWPGLRANWKGTELEGSLLVFEGQFRGIIE